MAEKQSESSGRPGRAISTVVALAILAFSGAGCDDDSGETEGAKTNASAGLDSLEGEPIGMAETWKTARPWVPRHPLAIGVVVTPVELLRERISDGRERETTDESPSTAPSDRSDGDVLPMSSVRSIVVSVGAVWNVAVVVGQRDDERLGEELTVAGRAAYRQPLTTCSKLGDSAPSLCDRLGDAVFAVPFDEPRSGVALFTSRESLRRARKMGVGRSQSDDRDAGEGSSADERFAAFEERLPLGAGLEASAVASTTTTDESDESAPEDDGEGGVWPRWVIGTVDENVVVRIRDDARVLDEFGGRIDRAREQVREHATGGDAPRSGERDGGAADPPFVSRLERMSVERKSGELVYTIPGNSFDAMMVPLRLQTLVALQGLSDALDEEATDSD